MTVGIFVEYFQGGGWENPEEETQVSHKRGRHRAPASLLDYCGKGSYATGDDIMAGMVLTNAGQMDYPKPPPKSLSVAPQK